MILVISVWCDSSDRYKTVMRADISSGNYDTKSLLISGDDLAKLKERYPVPSYRWTLVPEEAYSPEEGEIIPTLDEVLLEGTVGNQTPENEQVFYHQREGYIGSQQALRHITVYRFC